MSTDAAAAAEHAELASTPWDLSPGTRRPPSRSARLALLAFASYLTVAFFVLVQLGRHYWFYRDEWGVLLRDLRTSSGLFGPLNQHWVTLPVLAYHVLFWAFGLNYRPYQVCAILLHLTLAALLRVMMRRAGVGPWFATIAAGTFVLYGAGNENILIAIQMSLVGSVVLGVMHLLCADHDGPFTRRDGLGVIFGALGLMTSGVGAIMVVIVGIAVFLRRGWRMAALHVLPLAVLFGAWYGAERDAETIRSSGNVLKYAVQWSISGERSIFIGIGTYRVVALALALVLVVGLVIAWRPLDAAQLRRSASAPAALLLGVPVLFALVSTQRYFLDDEATSSKFVHIGTAFTLPALAIAAQALARHWRKTLPIVVALLLVGVPGNLGKFSTDGIFPSGFFASEKRVVLGSAFSPLAKRVSRQLTPDNSLYGAGGVTIGFLLDARSAGRLPAPPHLSSTQLDEIVVRLGVAQIYGAAPRALSCHRYAGSVVLTPPVGTVYVLDQPIAISHLQRAGRPYWGTVDFGPDRGALVLKIQLPDLRLTVRPHFPRFTIRLCRPRETP